MRKKACDGNPSSPNVDKLTPRPLFLTPVQDKAGSKQSHLLRNTVPASSSLDNMLKASADSWFSMLVHTEAVFLYANEKHLPLVTRTRSCGPDVTDQTVRRVVHQLQSLLIRVDLLDSNDRSESLDGQIPLDQQSEGEGAIRRQSLTSSIITSISWLTSTKTTGAT